MTLFDKAQALKFPNLVAINFDHRSDLEEFPGSFWLYDRLFSISVFLKKSSIDFQPSYFSLKKTNSFGIGYGQFLQLCVLISMISTNHFGLMTKFRIILISRHEVVVVVVIIT